jgi:single-stranded-DNA-specific exonuclease
MQWQSVKTISRRTPVSSLDLTQTGDGEIDLSPLLKRIFENRNLSNPAELNYPLAGLLPPDTLRDGDHAVKLLLTALKEQQRILVIGDYDTDGATATVLALLCLESMGAEKLDYLVPNRFEYGYGLSPEIAVVALQKQPDLVITVDNGINSVEGVSALREKGVCVLVTDHHLAGPNLPDANAILNPNQPGCEFPSKALAGVGVMFYLLMLLRAKLIENNWFADRSLSVPKLGDYLDLVALGTVADVVPLDYNNRILVAQGIARIRAGRCRPGIIALMEAGNKHYGDIVSSDFGFVIAPRLNAAGRLEDISIGIECLLTEDVGKAREIASRLNEINMERREIEQEMQSQALDTVRKIMKTRAASESSMEALTNGFCLYEPGWHQGITGLVASRVKDKTNQPVIAFADIADEKMSGSARSIPGLHIRDLLERIALENPGLILKFGGHAMAAGLTIERGNLELFKSMFQQCVLAHFERVGTTTLIQTDGELTGNEMTLDIAEQLRTAAPWGQGFPAPVFDGRFAVTEQRVVGQYHLKLKLRTLDSRDHFDGIAFRAVEPGQQVPRLDRIHAVYELDVNEYMGRRSLQLIIGHIQPISA